MSETQEMEKQFKTTFEPITDPKRIAELDKMDLYIAPNETDVTFDQEHIQNDFQNLKDSEKTVGQLKPIEVCVWPDDPEKGIENSHERIDMRIINGRHRYRANKGWRREYYDFTQYAKVGGDAVAQYWFARGHFDLQKKQPKEERAVFINDLAEHYMKLGTPANQCCTMIVNLLEKQGISSSVRIREVCDSKFKDKEMANRKLEKTFKATGRETKEEKKLKKVAGQKFADMEGKALKFESENTNLMKEQDGLRKTISEQDKAMVEMQSDLRIYSVLNAEETIDGIKIKATIKDKKIVIVKA